MNKDQFIYWLKGFVDAAQVSPTQIQWKLIKEKLDEIKDCPDFGSPIGEGGWGTPNTTPIWQQPHYPNPWDQPGIKYKYPSDINKITCEGTGTTTNGMNSVITTNGNTSITTELPKYSTLTYTLKDDSKDS